MSTTDIKVGTINAGKSATATISDVNPDKSNAKLKEFGQKLVALTSNTYQKTDRIITMNCDTETYDPSPLPEPTFELSATSATAASINGDTYPHEIATVNTNSDGKIYVRSSSSVELGKAAYVFYHESTKKLSASKGVGISVGAQTFYVGVLPTENFAGKEVAFTITE